ncbi:shikimate kinase [Granulosicoccaceae sp. 1_MG-2023]|nr:shikimate kinase [Granulosicoccaceae sp. 1_MG-2023]
MFRQALAHKNTRLSAAGRALSPLAAGCRVCGRAWQAGVCDTVWVKATPEEHMSRVMDQGDMRPMADNEKAMEDLKLILTEREAEYAMADFVLDTSHRKVLDCSLELARRCEEFLQTGGQPDADA